MEKKFGKQENRERGRGRKAFWIIVGAALLMGVVVTTWSPRNSDFDGFRTHSTGVEWNVKRVLDVIDASDEQRVALQPALERTRTDAQQINLAERELRAEILAVLEASQLDPAEVSRLRASAIRLSESAIETAVESTMEIWAVLTPEQRTEVLRHWKRRG